MEKFKIKEVKAQSILQKSGLPDADWVINPYTGCRIGCKYCYAAFVGRFRHPDEEWGTYVDVKINAPELLRSELTELLEPKGSVLRRRSDPLKLKDIGAILLSSVTDPYQGLEAKYKLTRRCLEVLVELGYEGKIGILTKSSLVLRDVDLFKKLNNVFVGPLLPHFVFMKDEMEKLLKQLKQAGVDYIYLEHLNLAPYIRARLFDYLKKDYPDELEKFVRAQAQIYRQKLGEMLLKLTKEIGLPVAHQKPIYHQDNIGWKKSHGRKRPILLRKDGSSTMIRENASKSGKVHLS